MRPLKTPPPTPPELMHQSLTVHFQHPLTPQPQQSQGKPSGYMLSPREIIQKKKKEHMKEAQSPKNVESGVNLYKCDPSTDHSGTVHIYP